MRSLLARNESVPCCGEEEPCVHYAITPPASSRGAVTRRTSSLTDDESGNNSGGAVAVALSRIEHSVLREKRVLVVLDDLERVLVATGARPKRARRVSRLWTILIFKNDPCQSVALSSNTFRSFQIGLETTL